MRRVLSVLLGCCAALRRTRPAGPRPFRGPTRILSGTNPRNLLGTRIQRSQHTPKSRLRSPARGSCPGLQPGSVRGLSSVEGQPALLPENTHLARGSEPAQDPWPRLDRRPLSPSREARLVPVGKTANKEQPSNLRNERLPQTLVTRTPFFPSACLGQPGAREKVTNMYLLPFSSPLKKDVSNEKVVFP